MRRQGSGDLTDSLFEAAELNGGEPLAARMRPRILDEFIGQEHIVAPGRLLRRAIDADQLSSLIFYGPPGTGKTTLARLIAGKTSSRFVTLNAVLAGVADIRREIEAAQTAGTLHGRKTILFVDEVHRWNKSQQDALLPWVENGTVVLIGATTENPYFEVNKALVSRSRVFQLLSLEDKHLRAIAEQALSNTERGYGRWDVRFEEGTLEHLVNVSAGDARSLLNALQLAVETTPDSFPPEEGALIEISLAAAEESIQKKALLYDKDGDYHFDTISAFIKSIRGSDPDAALYWMALMIRAGENPKYIFRRMLISASEDVGLAAPEALGVVTSCAEAFDRIGLPEGQFHLAQACLYLASAPKSNSTLGYYDALRAVEEEASRDVPSHLKDGSRDKHAFGHGEGYKYPHAWRNHWTAQQYLPGELSGRIFYRPGELGHEGHLRESVLLRRELQVAAMLNDEGEESAEGLTFSPGDDERERWVKRTETSAQPVLLRIRNLFFEDWNPERHHRILVLSDIGGTLIWEANRKVPEGGVTALCGTEESLHTLQWLADGLPESERPRLIRGSLESASVLETLTADSARFEAVLGRNQLARKTDSECRTVLQTAAPLIESGGVLRLLEPRPEAGTALADVIPGGLLNPEDERRFRECERSVIQKISTNRSAADWKSLLEDSGWTNALAAPREVESRRGLSAARLEAWLTPSRPGGYGALMAEAMGREEWTRMAARIKAILNGRSVSWNTGFFLISARTARTSD